MSNVRRVLVFSDAGLLRAGLTGALAKAAGPVADSPKVKVRDPESIDRYLPKPMAKRQRKLERPRWRR